jgi:hypothetical protein
MRKFILLLAWVTCFGCDNGSSEAPLGVPGGRDLNNVGAQTMEPPRLAGRDADVPVPVPVSVPVGDSTQVSADSTGTAPTSPANADVTNVRAVFGSDSWTFHVTVDHPDTGWDDYADGWDVVLPDGTVIKPAADSPFTRLLLHPHENERPFTRSQSGIVIPAGVTSVLVRAHDLVDGFGGRQVAVDLQRAVGEGFTVERQGP